MSAQNANTEVLVEALVRRCAGTAGDLCTNRPRAVYFHTDRETPDTVPWTGLQATTRAYAKIVDEVNKHPLSTFQRPEEPVPSSR